jgi:signal transduction histidine kinase
MNLGWFAAAALAGFAALRAARRPDERRARRSWTFAALGALAWAGGQSYWAWSVLSGADELPFPSWADVGYLAALPLFGAAVVFWPRRRTMSRRDLWDAVVGLAVALLVMFEFAVEAILIEWDWSLASWTALAYPVLEFFVIAPLVIGFLLNAWADRFRIVVLGTGLVALATADAAFSVAVSASKVWAPFFDPIWVGAFAAVGAAALVPSGYAPSWFVRMPPVVYIGALTAGVAALALADAVESPREVAVGGYASYFLAVLVIAGVARVFSLAQLRQRTARELREAQAELRRAQTARDRFMVNLVNAQEADSQKIADVLHDDVVQQLTALGFRIELAAQTHDVPELRQLAAGTSEITRSIRRLLVELYPAILESQGLGPAIEIAAEHLRDRGTKVNVSPFPHRLERETEVLAYRVVQEALAHVAEHGRAATATVDLDVRGRRLHGLVTDDGWGATVDDSDGLGLLVARERVELAGGRYLFAASKGKGTTIRFELPLEQMDVPSYEKAAG